jgi:excisionase family DNA binding protein
MEPLTVSIAQAAATSGLSRATLYRMIDRSELDTIKVGSRRLVRVASLKALLGEA